MALILHQLLVKDKKQIYLIIRHIDYIRDLVGIENVVLGTDYDGIDNTPKGLEDLGKLDNLKEELLRRNYSLRR